MKGHAGCPFFYESEEVRQRGSEGFTDKEKIADVGLVDLIWDVYKRGAMECLFSHSPPEELFGFTCCFFLA